MRPPAAASSPRKSRMHACCPNWRAQAAVRAPRHRTAAAHAAAACRRSSSSGAIRHPPIRLAPNPPGLAGNARAPAAARAPRRAWRRSHAGCTSSAARPRRRLHAPPQSLRALRLQTLQSYWGQTAWATYCPSCRPATCLRRRGCRAPGARQRGGTSCGPPTARRPGRGGPTCLQRCAPTCQQSDATLRPRQTASAPKSRSKNSPHSCEHRLLLPLAAGGGQRCRRCRQCRRCCCRCCEVEGRAGCCDRQRCSAALTLPPPSTPHPCWSRSPTRPCWSRPHASSHPPTLSPLTAGASGSRSRPASSGPPSTLGTGRAAASGFSEPSSPTAAPRPRAKPSCGSLCGKPWVRVGALGQGIAHPGGVGAAPRRVLLWGVRVRRQVAHRSLHARWPPCPVPRRPRLPLAHLQEPAGASRLLRQGEWAGSRAGLRVWLHPRRRLQYRTVGSSTVLAHGSRVLCGLRPVLPCCLNAVTLHPSARQLSCRRSTRSPP